MYQPQRMPVRPAAAAPMQPRQFNSQQSPLMRMGAGVPRGYSSSFNQAQPPQQLDPMAQGRPHMRWNVAAQPQPQQHYPGMQGHWAGMVPGWTGEGNWGQALSAWLQARRAQPQG